MIKVQNLHAAYGDKIVLSDISFSINQNETTAIVGPNACGKSSLLKAINSEIPIFKGEVEIDGKSSNFHYKNNKEIAKWRAVLPQSNNLNFNFKVIEVVMMGRSPHLENTTEKDNLGICEASLEKLEIAHLKERSYLNLSGGEQQRVHFARILAQMHECVIQNKKGIIFLDEPTSNLDLKHQYRILEIIKELKNHGIYTVFVIHNLEQAYNYSEKIILMDKGKLIDFGSPSNVLSKESIKRVFEINSEWVKEGDLNFLKVLQN